MEWLSFNSFLMYAWFHQADQCIRVDAAWQIRQSKYFGAKILVDRDMLHRTDKIFVIKFESREV
jgi:hypothetical protein